MRLKSDTSEVKFRVAGAAKPRKDQEPCGTGRHAGLLRHNRLVRISLREGRHHASSGP